MIDTGSPYAPSDEAEAAADWFNRGPKAYADLMRRMAQEPGNAAIREKIEELARRFDEFGC